MTKFGKTKTKPWLPGPDEEAKQAEKIRKNMKVLKEKGIVRFPRRQVLEASADLELRLMKTFNQELAASRIGKNTKKMQRTQSSSDLDPKMKYMKDNFRRVRKWQDQVKMKNDIKDKLQCIDWA